jgi:hypothetical protein
MKRITLLATTLAALLFCGFPGHAQGPSKHLLYDAATGKLQPATIPVQIGPHAPTVMRRMPFFSGGILTAVTEAINGTKTTNSTLSSSTAPAVPGQSTNTVGCSERTSQGNVRTNQDCTFRRQAEEKIAFNPANPSNLLAGQNDSRVGFNQCGIDFSNDDGNTWGDLLPPFRQKINNPQGELPTASDPNQHTIAGDPGTFHTYDAGSDPAPAFDSQGRGFFSCVAFDVFSNAAMVYVAQSPLGAQGSFFLNIGTFSRRFVVVEDNSPNIVHDKEFVTADTFVNSRNRDNVYETWTVFKFGCGPSGGFCSSPIFGSMSTDNGQTWSTPEEISGNNPTLCFFGNFFDPTRSPSDCDFDQGSDPAVLPNGDLEVILNNGNTAANNPNAQQLGVHCSPSGSSPAGTAHLNCGVPSKVGDDVIIGEPLCDFGRGPEECVPGPFIRTNDFPRIGVNRANGDLFATWQDYRNGEYDIQLATSTDGGFSWSLSATVNPDSALDHYMPATDVATFTDTDRVGVSYYRSQRVPNENTTPAGGFAPGQPGVQQANSDYALAGGTSLAAPFTFQVVSPVFPSPDGVQAGFNGDYSGLAINNSKKNKIEAHPIWSDTRNADPFTPLNGVLHDEDVFTLGIRLPNGVGAPGVGQIGQN